MGGLARLIHAIFGLAIELTGTTLGTFLHRCFEVLGVNAELGGKLASSCPLMRDSRIAELAKRLRTISKITSPGKKNDSAPQNEPYLRPQGPRFVERTAIL